MNFEYTTVMNFKNAMRGMRNALASWDRADSICGYLPDDRFDSDLIEVATAWAEKTEHYNELSEKEQQDLISHYASWLVNECNAGTLDYDENNEVSSYAYIGPNDMKLMQTLIKAGSSHRKFLRQIFISVDISAGLYFWKEFDTYKVGTVANSTSTMHKLASTPITLDCFDTDMEEEDFSSDDYDTIMRIIGFLEELRKRYNDTKDKKYWRELIQFLPESWIQKRTVTLSYENVYAMIRDRHNHKLHEWSGKDDMIAANFIDWARRLPYAEQLLFIGLEN